VFGKLWMKLKWEFAALCHPFQALFHWSTGTGYDHIIRLACSSTKERNKKPFLFALA